MKFLPLEDRVLIRPDALPEKSKGGIILEAAERPPAYTGEIVAIGPGLPGGPSMRVKSGDRVYFSPYSGIRVLVGDETFHCMRESEILGVMECQEASLEPASA